MRRTLRRRLPSCEVVLMSVHESEALRIAALEAGASAYIAQRELPVSLSPIVHRLFKNAPLSPKTDIRPI
jgi:DNA-binding NarL/FixJ family response regulator